MRCCLPLLLLACGPDPANPSNKLDTADPPSPGVDSEDCPGADGGGTDGAADGGDGAAEGTDGAGDGAGDSAPDSGGDGGGDSGLPPTGPPAVLLFIGDGMGFEHLRGGGLYANGAVGSLTIESLPIQGRLRTASLSGTTDSAAGATTYATGVKTWNGRLGLDGEGLARESIAELARACGLSVGVVTTDGLTGATPSAFLVHEESRFDASAIAEQAADFLPDVMMGGDRDLLEPLLDLSAVQLVTTSDELEAAVPDGRPLVGLYADGTLPYVSDADLEAPTLARMTERALEVLQADPEGFLLIVEGARIDHASHSNREESVHQETAAFDDAVAVGLSWAEAHPGASLAVTADHECGGMRVDEGSAAGELPDTRWRWSLHTNADVTFSAFGPAFEHLDGLRSDAREVHPAIVSALTGRPREAAEVGPLVDGYLEELGAPLEIQSWSSDFGPGFNQLDALYLSADAQGLRIGLAGAFELDENAVVVLLDVDPGAGTGVGGDAEVPTDEWGSADTLLVELLPRLELSDPGLGFDLAFVAFGGEEVQEGAVDDRVGLRGLRDPWGEPDDLWWLGSTVSYDDGNVSVDGAPARDADRPGLTEGGMEVLISWEELAPLDGTSGLDIQAVALLVNEEGTWVSNQSLPSFPSSAGPGGDAVPVDSVVELRFRP